jgi:hypothetical protein
MKPYLGNGEKSTPKRAEYVVPLSVCSLIISIYFVKLILNIGIIKNEVKVITSKKYGLSLISEYN